MPHAALWVVQQTDPKEEEFNNQVSMPHAALWVVQLVSPLNGKEYEFCFNAARGFVGGAA